MTTPLGIIASIAEQRIQKAQEEGAFAHLPGLGKPLLLEDESHIPEDLRMAYKVLRNAGFVPPELEERKEVSRLLDLLEKESDEQEQLQLMQKVQYLLQRIGTQRQRPVTLEDSDPYYAQMLQRLARARQGRTPAGSK